MSVQSRMEGKLSTGLDVVHLEVINESRQHNVPPGSESHFKVVLVSDDFEGKSLLQRHRMVYELLAEEVQGPVHALALHTYTEADWRAQSGGGPASPKCLGGKALETDQSR